MPKPSFSRLALAGMLALALAACGQGDKTEAGAGTVSGDKIAPIAAPSGKAWSEVVAMTPEGGYVMGNPQAPIKLIEYGSLSCPHCAKFAQEGFGELSKDFVGSGRVSYEFRSFAIHPQDIPLTMLVRCGANEAFFPLVEQIYSNFDALNAPLGDQAVQTKVNAAAKLTGPQRLVALSDALGYTQFFAQRGVAVDQANACLAKTETATDIANHAQKYGEDGVNGTPTLLVNGTKVDSTEWADTRKALIAAGAR